MTNSDSRRLLVGTNNPGKVQAIAELLTPLGITCIRPIDLGLTDDVTEDGHTFADNSRIKADFYWARLHCPVLTDDSGVEIAALNNEPGVHTRRWLGRAMSDAEVTAEALRRIAPIPLDQRQARMTTVMTLRLDEQTQIQVTGTMEGEIRPSSLPTRPGMPIGPIFWVPAADKFFSEFTAADRQRWSHRAQAIAQLRDYFERL